MFPESKLSLSNLKILSIEMGLFTLFFGRTSEIFQVEWVCYLKDKLLGKAHPGAYSGICQGGGLSTHWGMKTP